MKFIHCSDIHLDSKMERNLSATQARERNAEICATFARMIRYAQENQVTAILIAGDLFDTHRASAQTAQFVLDRIAAAKDVDFLYLRGNHDESRTVLEGVSLPDNLKTFNSPWISYQYGDVVITGREPEGSEWDAGFEIPPLSEAHVNIVMLHGQVSTQPGSELIPLPQFTGKHIDYLALGHLHSFKLEKLDSRGVYCYCGCLEGRGFDECGSKGFVLLDIQDHRVNPEFIPFASRQLYDIPVDISDLVTVTQLNAALDAAAADIPSSALVKFTLTGSYTPESQKDLGFLTKMQEPSFYFVKIKDESHLQIQKSSYEHDISLKGEFIRTVMASHLREDEKEAIICCGLRALRGEEVEL